ncbi:MAG: 3-hydroxyacyl-CoA dehydrogenase family protein [Pseudomonadota bacterium]
MTSPCVRVAQAQPGEHLTKTGVQAYDGHTATHFSPAPMSQPLHVTVVGAGLMGHSIAQVFAVAGHPVNLCDVQPQTLAGCTARIRHNLQQLGLDADPVLARITLSPDLASAVAGANLVIEAAPESLALKQQLFLDIAEAAPASAWLASNTSVIPITDIGARLASSARARLVGTHWWNPPHLIPLVEVVSSAHTDLQVFEGLFSLLKQVGKTPVKVRRDLPGFIGNRLQFALWREAISLVADGVCDAETLDTVVKQSFGRRLGVLGPLENADLIGLALARDIQRLLLPHLNDSHAPSPLLDTLLSQGHAGMATLQGLRGWTHDTAHEAQERLARHLIALAHAERDATDPTTQSPP